MVLDMKTGMGQECVHLCQREHSGLDEVESKYTELRMEHVSHQSGLWTESEGKEGKEGHYHQTIHIHFASGGKALQFHNASKI